MQKWIERIADWSFTPVFVSAIFLNHPALWLTFAAIAIYLFVRSFKNKPTVETEVQSDPDRGNS